ncbi:hypothetical protein Focb16_v008193 [Fusarium oxysporum f. sp. cubense]|jgi:predicted SnoaL-like aldol condensation-catalyzing enzyme|uniref:SnoaL-like domain-containing protein n=1 Tax=Fusarium oxysporum f. sp. cubense TaxID=61366 RepID=A0A559LUT8_FUSOC|nr:hypothetical protein Focb16_v008193 [Fusarium oxysporum f. sp. cubense]
MTKLQELIDKAYSSLVDQPPHTPKQVTIVKALLELYLATFVLKDYDTTARLIPLDYKQHDPMVGDGRQSIIEFFNFMQDKTTEIIGRTAPIPDIFFKRILVDGPYVIVHAHVRRWPEDEGLAVVDLFRYENGLFVEHWDVIQPVPENAKNSNGMF